MPEAFTSIDQKDWLLADTASRKIRDVLHKSESFDVLVRKLAASSKIVKQSLGKSSSFPGYFRAEIKIQVNRTICMQFHSGRRGYRAQYFHDVTVGERANRFAVSMLSESILPRLGKTSFVTREWIAASLLGNRSKIWIHQGRWLRRRELRDRLLLLPRWLQWRSSDDEQRRKLALWACLAPGEESKFDIKGTFLDHDGREMGVDPKPDRGKQIHELGFT